jgi:signal transduction histidine kinase/CheY-like chemotaxis protein
VNISTRLKVAGAFSAGVVAVIVAILMWTTQQVKHSLAENEVAARLLEATASIRYLTFEYVLRHDERTEAQWRLRHASLSKLLADTTAFIAPDEREVANELRGANDGIGALFPQLVTTHEERQAGAGRGEVLEELEARLTAQIMNKAQAMIAGALDLSERSRAGVFAAQQRAGIAVTAFGGVMVVIVSATLLLAFRSIVRPLAKLRDGTAMVGAGDLNFRLGITTADEIGDLARAFDAMTERLKGTTVSRDELVRANEELQAEIQVRQQTEKKVQAQLERLNLLHQITRAIGERQDLRSIFQVVIRSVEDQLPVDFCCVCLHDPVSNMLTVTAVGVRSEPLAVALAMPEHARITVDENGLARCVRGQLVYEPDVSASTFPFPQRLARGGLNALVFAPLRVESHVFGVLVAARHVPHSFVSGECEFLNHLSGHVALAAHQAQLHGALQQAYDDLRQTQQAVLQQERLRALGQMASGIAHDINNAISPVALYVESLLEKEPGLSERSRNYLGTIQRAVDDVAHTVARMREFYRPRESESMLATTDLNVLAQQVIDLTRARWSDMPQQRGVVIQMQTDFSADLPAISSAQAEIREALINLVFNAVDAMPEGGTLTLRTTVRHASAPLRVCVEVADTGIGMDEDTRSRCLEPFFTTKGERGTGLGLAMVYGVAQRHSAEFEIESAVGAGTTVRLCFPLPAVVPDGARTEEAFEMPPRLRILLVDDDPLLLKSLRDTLEADGHAIAQANGGQAGIDAFRAAQAQGEIFDVVITDLGMPNIDGRRVAEGIKTASPPTPVILLTGWGQRLVADGEVPPHVSCVLGKPPRLQQLRWALAKFSRPANAADAPRPES